MVRRQGRQACFEDSEEVKSRDVGWICGRESTVEVYSFNLMPFLCVVWVDIHVCVSAHVDQENWREEVQPCLWMQKLFSLSKKMLSINMLSESP